MFVAAILDCDVVVVVAVVVHFLMRKAIGEKVFPSSFFFFIRVFLRFFLFLNVFFFPRDRSECFVVVHVVIVVGKKCFLLSVWFGFLFYILSVHVFNFRYFNFVDGFYM